MAEERRPHRQRKCPWPGCDWKQTISWYVGGPGRTERVNDKFLELEATTHMLNHARPMKTVTQVNGRKLAP